MTVNASDNLAPVATANATVLTAKPTAWWKTAATMAVLVASLAYALYRTAPLWTAETVGGPEQRTTPLTQTDWDNAMRRLDTKQSDAALQYIQLSKGSSLLTPQRSILQGRMYLDAGKLFAAKQAFQEAVGNAKLNAMAYYWLGATHYALRDIASAENFFLQALELNAKDVNTHRSLSMIYYDRGAIDHAVQHLREVAALAQEDARPHRLLGLIYKDYERYGEAADFYRAALARQLVDETRHEVLVELAECLLKMREYEESLSVLREAPVTPVTLVLKADCLVGLGKSEEAIPLLDELLTAAPDNVEAMVIRAGIHTEQQQHEAAVQLLNNAVVLKPTDYLANFRLSQALRSTGETERAAEVAARADELKRMREQFSKLHQDATARPLDADVRYELGALASQLAMPELAITWLRVALELDPQHAKAQEMLKSLTATPSEL